MSCFHGSVTYGKNKIAFIFFYANRKTLEIAVHPDQTVVVKAPAGTDYDEIKKKVTKRAGWITRQRSFFQQFDPRTPPRSYVGGETHLYMGRHYRLRISSGNQNTIKLTRGYFEIEVMGKVSPASVRNLLEVWYRHRAEVKFNESLDRLWLHYEKRSVTKPELQIKRMQKRWGSLSAKGRLTLNIDLIRAPMECIDYVIVHELSHMRYKNHGPEFYRLLDRIMPDWEKRKHKLEITLA